MDNSFINSKKIMLADDEPDLLRMLTEILKDSGFHDIITSTSISESIILAKNEKPDLAILDIMFSDGDGFTLLQKLRTFTDIPIIFLTAKDDAIDKISGLGLGADDYITKPFMPQEFLLRVYAILRRCYKVDDNSIINLEGYMVDFSRAEVNKNGVTIPLTSKEYTLLNVLYRNEGKIVSIDAICEALWGDNPFGYENSLNTHIRRIREKIEINPSKPVSLITIKGLGYKLNLRK